MKNFIELVVGDLEGKKEYKKLMKRVDKLPEDYRYTFKKIQNYMYANGGGDLTIFEDIVEMFEQSSLEGKKVLDVIGQNVSSFADGLLISDNNYFEKKREKLNDEIKAYFLRKED